ncbi:MAG: hypothetical protein WCA81_11470 [Rhizomicrobium sp.]
MRRIVLFCVLAIATTAAAFALEPTVPYVWSSVPFGGGGFVSGIIYHPSVPGLVYIRTDVGGAYRWDAGKKSWIALNDDIGRDDAQLLGVVSIAVDPNNPSRVYLACGQYLADWGHKAAILRSTDRGATWARTDLPIKLGGNADGRSTGERLQVDPNNPDTLFLGTNQDGLWRSADAGVSWSQVSGFSGNAVTFVLFQASSSPAGSNTKTIYVGTADTKKPSLYRSQDGGSTWAAVPGAPQSLMPHRAAFDANGTLYLAYSNDIGPNNITNGAVWKFDPVGAKWTDITPEQPGRTTFGYSGISADAHHPGVVIVSTLDRWVPGDDLFRSTDGGLTWKSLRAKSVHNADNAAWFNSYSGGKDVMGHWIGDVEIDPFNSDAAAYITGYGLWHTDNVTAVDSGNTVNWSFDVAGLEETVPVALASPPKGPHLVTTLGDVAGASYAGADVDKITGLNSPTSESNRSIDFAEAYPAYMVRTSDQAPTSGYFSIDGGQSWKGFASTPRIVKDAEGHYHTADRIAVSAGTKYLVWAPQHQTAYYSEDHGVSWHECAGWPQSTDETFIPVADRAAEGVFYVMDRTKGAMYISIDGGKHFTVFSENAPKWGGEMRAVPGHVRALWVPTPNGLYYSPDENSAFTSVHGITEAFAVGLGKPAPGHSEPAVYCWCRIKTTTGIFRSDDSGESWVRINDDQHQFGWITAIIGDPRIYGRVYLATGGRGVMKGDIATSP